MTDTLVRLAVDGDVATVTLDRPRKRNAITLEMLADTADSLDEAASAGCGAAVLTGAGPAFCAGWDTTSFAKTAGQGADLSFQIQSLLGRIGACEIPLVAAVGGPALGGGCGLACVADLRVGAASATFGLPEINHGLIPGGGIVFDVAALTSSAVVTRMLLTGQHIGAEEALRVGLLDQVVADDDLMRASTALATQLAAQPAGAARAAKRLVRELNRAERERLIQVAAAEIQQLMVPQA